MGHSDFAVRDTALQALGQMAEKGDTATLDALRQHLEHEDWSVREAAVRALAKVAERGDTHTLQAVSACLNDPDPDVRLAAIQVLPLLADDCHEHAISEVRHRSLNGTSWSAQIASANLLERLDNDKPPTPAAARNLDLQAMESPLCGNPVALAFRCRGEASY